MNPNQPAAVTLPPTYKEMLEEIGRQLKERKKSILKRSLLISWPFILLIAASYLFEGAVNFKAFTSEQMVWAIGGLIAYVVLAIIYSGIVRFIFEIEKQIWIDSYFDKKNLDLKQSWMLAKKLFWSAFKFRLQIALRYYVLPIGLTLLVIAGGVVAFFTSSPTGDMQSYFVMAIPVVVIVIIVSLFFYGYYLKTKLRYTWFVFLDKYGSEYTYHSIMDEVDELNQISKSETFKKSLLVNLGTDSVRGVANMAVGIIGMGFAQLGGAAGRAVGGVIRMYGQEVARQATDLGNIAAQYILYRFARKERFGEEQVVNENLYTI
ncbi:MAG: hypothetical protein V4526_01430 [Patescibacteria group bacterium]